MTPIQSVPLFDPLSLSVATAQWVLAVSILVDLTMLLVFAIPFWCSVGLSVGNCTSGWSLRLAQLTFVAFIYCTLTLFGESLSALFAMLSLLTYAPRSVWWFPLCMCFLIFTLSFLLVFFSLLYWILGGFISPYGSDGRQDSRQSHSNSKGND